MESEGSLQCSQQPAIGPYPKPDESSLHLPTLTYLLTPWCRTLIEKLIFTQLVKKISCFLMELEGSLSCSQKRAIGTYPEPAESSSPHQSLSP